MEVFIVTDTHAGIPVEVFKHYLHASNCIEEAEKNGSSADQYRIDGPFNVTIGLVVMGVDNELP